MNDVERASSVGGGASGECSCRDRSAAPAASLAVLQEVHRAYRARLEAIEKKGGKKKLELQVEALRAWVGDLVGQNTLLAQAVEELERDATSRLLIERTRHSEIEAELRVEVSGLRRRLARKDSDLRGLVEVLRRLREFDYCTLDGIHFFEVTESDIFGSMLW
ncbi:uncharacterized protein LOC113235830 [Hyposmocoma kahamanoa]|uniref:uncharacterized protein LOC113235830 n=1 Tax=Hyposmocoma kahamanoa TaxID=1477025 RepID=UPI000E6D8319|nr:uncharacterized protein LOC113235830 [Hyposmocoma kahamanoa]